LDSLQQMYQQVILDHAKKPHGRTPGAPEQLGAAASSVTENGTMTATSHQVNPTCGDEITLTLKTKDGKIQELVWQGQGCSISQASASVMTDLVSQAPLVHAKETEQLFFQLMNSRGQGLDDDAEDELGDAVAFTGTSQYPARIKCALLGWMALKDAIAKAENDG